MGFSNVFASRFIPNGRTILHATDALAIVFRDKGVSIQHTHKSSYKQNKQITVKLQTKQHNNKWFISCYHQAWILDHRPQKFLHPRKLYIFWFDSFIFDYSYY